MRLSCFEGDTACPGLPRLNARRSDAAEYAARTGLPVCMLPELAKARPLRVVGLASTMKESLEVAGIPGAQLANGDRLEGGLDTSV